MENILSTLVYLTVRRMCVTVGNSDSCVGLCKEYLVPQRWFLY